MRRFQKKVCMLGDRAVGKSALVKRYVLDQFDDSYLRILGTKIIKREEPSVPLSLALGAYEKVDISMVIWDINHRFIHPISGNPMMESYLKGAGGAIFVVDSTDKKSLEVIERQIGSYHEINGWGPMVFVANKRDLFDLILNGFHARKIDRDALERRVYDVFDSLEIEDSLIQLLQMQLKNKDTDDLIHEEQLEEISKLGDYEKEGYVAPHFYTSALTSVNVKKAFRILACELIET